MKTKKSKQQMTKDWRLKNKAYIKIYNRNYRKTLSDDKKRQYKENRKKNKKSINQMTDLELLKDTIQYLQKKLRDKEYRKSEARKISIQKYKKSKTYKLLLRRYKETGINKERYKKYGITEKAKEARRKYKKTNKGIELRRRWQSSKACKEYQKKYFKNYKVSQDNRIRGCLRSRLRMAIKNNTKVGSAVKDLGCSIEELKRHLQSKFAEGMSWNNYGKYGWHIDHIKPLSNFDLTDRKQFLEACHYTNLQPLWAKDNLIKWAH